jgi:hypothetical protein
MYINVTDMMIYFRLIWLEYVDIFSVYVAWLLFRFHREWRFFSAKENPSSVGPIKDSHMINSVTIFFSLQTKYELSSVAIKDSHVINYVPITLTSLYSV